MLFKDDDFESPGLIQEVPKNKLHYTVTPIGDAAALAVYMKAKAAAEEKWQAEQAPKRVARRDKAVKVVAQELAPMTPGYEESKETAYLDRYTSASIQRRTATVNERIANAVPFAQYQKPQRTLLEKVTGLLTSVFFK